MVKAVSCLNREISSSCSGKFSYCVKMVFFKFSLMDDLRQWNTALEFWITQVLV